MGRIDDEGIPTRARDFSAACLVLGLRAEHAERRHHARRQCRLRRFRSLWGRRGSRHADPAYRSIRQRGLAAHSVPLRARLHSVPRGPAPRPLFAARWPRQHHHRRHPQHFAGQGSDDGSALQIEGLRHRHHRQMASRLRRTEPADQSRLRRVCRRSHRDDGWDVISRGDAARRAAGRRNRQESSHISTNPTPRRTS